MSDKLYAVEVVDTRGRAKTRILCDDINENGSPGFVIPPEDRDCGEDDSFASHIRTFSMREHAEAFCAENQKGNPHFDLTRFKFQVLELEDADE